MKAESMTRAADVQDAGEVFRIRPGVAKVERRESIVLVAPGDGKAVRMSPVALDLMPLLADGAGFDDLVALLREKYPRAGDAKPKLRAFLQQLATAGLLDTGGESRPRPWRVPRFPLFDPDPAAARLARVIALVPAWIGWSLLAAALAGSLSAIIVLAWTGGLPHPVQYVRGFDPGGLLVFALVIVPLHEGAHAVACRLAGARVGEAGIVLHGFLVPGPYIDTSQAYRLPRRLHRFWIPAAGPVVNFLATGAAASALIAVGDAHPAADTLAYVFLLSAAFVVLDTNLLGPTDGSHMVEAVLDDELARKSALHRRRSRLSHWKTVAKYRVAASLHVQGTAALAVAWWFS